MKEIVLMILEPTVAAVVPAVVAYLLTRFHQWSGVELDKANREALQSALANAAQIAVRKAASGTAPAIYDAVQYVRNSVPGAIKRFKLDDGQLYELLVPHVERAKR